MTAKYKAPWLAGFSSENTQRVYAQGLRDFEERMGICLDTARKIDVQFWKQQLVEGGLAKRTVNARLAAVSSYFEWCMLSDVRQDNPAKIHRMKLPRKFEVDAALTGDAAGALLQEIERRTKMGKPITRVRGLQDRALFLGYLLMGLRNHEWRRAKVEDFRVDGSMVMYHWYGKGKEGWQEVPAAVWDAVKMYTQAIGLFGGHLFFGLGVSALNLGHAHQGRGYITGQEVNRRLHYYARRAGIEKDGLRVHALRHTTAHLMDELGASREDVRVVFHHSSADTTDGYIGELRGTRFDMTRLAERIGV